MINKIELFFIKYMPGCMLLGWCFLMLDHFLRGVFSYWLLVLLFPLIGWYKTSKLIKW